VRTANGKHVGTRKIKRHGVTQMMHQRDCQDAIATTSQQH